MYWTNENTHLLMAQLLQLGLTMKCRRIERQKLEPNQCHIICILVYSVTVVKLLTRRCEDNEDVLRPFHLHLATLRLLLGTYSLSPDILSVKVTAELSSEPLSSSLTLVSSETLVAAFSTTFLNTPALTLVLSLYSVAEEECMVLSP